MNTLNTINILKTLFRWVVALLFCASAVAPLRATPVVSNNAGEFLDKYEDPLGIATANGVGVVQSGTVSLIGSNTRGDYTTVRIGPNSFAGWLELSFPGASFTTGELTAEVRSEDNSALLIAEQPVDPFVPINLSGLDPASVKGIRVKVYFKVMDQAPPTVDTLLVTWLPRSQVLLDKKAPAQVLAGEGIVYSLRYSVSYVQARRLVVWDPLPSYASRSLTYPTEIHPTPYPGQNDDPGFVSAINKGGLYTLAGTNVNGVLVPPKSVYWVLGDVPEGTTDLLSFTLATKNGTLDGTTVTNRAYAAATNAATSQSLAVTAIRSVPGPFIEKKQGAAIFKIADELQTIAGTTNSFSIIARNDFQSIGRETMYNTVIYDNVSELVDLITGLGFFNISPADGAYDPAFDPDGPGGLSPIPAIVWKVGTFRPGSSFSGSFSVKLRDSNDLPRTNYTNRVCMTSDQTSRVCDDMWVKIGLNKTPSGSFGKGDNASGFFSIAAQTDDNADFAVPYGGSVGFGLLVANNSAVKLNDVVLLDKVPTNTTFRSAWLGDQQLIESGAKIFYSTSRFSPENWTNAPPVDYRQAPQDLDEPGNNHWWRYDLNPPAAPKDVTWVAFYLPQVDSMYLPNNGRPALPATPITSAAGYFDVNVFTPDDQCTDALLLNRGLFRAYSRTDLGTDVKAPIDRPLTASDDEQVVAKGYIGRLHLVGRSAITPVPIELPATNSVYTLTVANDLSQTSDALNVQAVLQLSKVTVNGKDDEFPSVQEMPLGGTYNPDLGQITIPLGLLRPGASSNLHVRLGLPAGIRNKTEYTVTTTITGRDDKCGFSTITDVARGEVLSSPKLRVFKQPAFDFIRSAAEYDYALEYENSGTGPSTQTYVVDRVPERTVLVRAYGNQHVTRVLFSLDNELLPQGLTPFTPITGDIIAPFIEGTRTGDSWTSTLGEGTRWIAWQVDDPSLSPPQLPLTTNRTVYFSVRNDHDGSGPATAGSPEGTQLFNEAGIFSSELLQAIGNQVITTVKDHPSIIVQKSGPSEVEAGVPFKWVVTYYNNSLTPADTVVITETLPPGIVLTSAGASNAWNVTALSNGAPVGNDGRPVPTSVVNNDDGSTTLTFNIAGPSGYRGLNARLGPLEGGTLTLNVNSDLAAVCDTPYLNEVRGTATTGSNSITSFATHRVTIRCPDLELLKYASPAEVLAGGTLTYTLEVANRGPIAARGVTLIDTLPPGVSYSGSLSVTPGYTLGAPAISGQTLTWSVTNNNALTRTGLPPGEVPDNSGKIKIQFATHVGIITGCPPLTLMNMARVSTLSHENVAYQNDASASAVVPPPELAVTESGPVLALPGNRVSWNLHWLNQTLQAATGVYLINTLPNNVTFISVDAPEGVIPFYHSGPFTPFEPGNPEGGGWSRTPTTRVNHVALLVGALAGNAGQFTAQVTMALIDPNGGVHPFPLAGTCFTNTVVIHQAFPQCERTDNNVATAAVCTPALDLALTKTGSVQGSIPGIAPGQTITYTLEFENSGTVPAYGVRVTDTLPASLQGDLLDNFTVVALEGGPPVDLLENPIVAAVPVTRVINGNTVTWYLGATNSGSLNYTNVGLPPGSRGSFHLYVTVAESAADGTDLCNQATVTADVGIEEFLNNNTGRSCTTVWRPDLALRKTALTSDPNFVEFNQLLTYKIEYNNIGHIAAQNVVIDEMIPKGTTLVSVDRPRGATVTYSTNQGNVTSFSVNLGTLQAPANSVGEDFNESPQGGGNEPKLSIDRVVNAAGLTIAVTVTWPDAFRCFTLEVTSQLENTNGWHAEPVQPASSGGRQEVTIPFSTNMPNCFFRLRRSGACCSSGPFYANANPEGFLGWKTLFVDDTVPTGTDIRYSVGRLNGTNYVYDLGQAYTDVSVGPNGLDLSGINPAYTNLVLRATPSTNGTTSPCVNAWKMTYESAFWPFFTFIVKVDGRGAECGDALRIDNEATIGTPTPEISLANNIATNRVNTRFTDLQVVRCAVNAAAREGEILTYTLDWEVTGPMNVPFYLQVVLPDADRNGAADVRSVAAGDLGAGVTAYYNPAPTGASLVFDPHNPLTNGWNLLTNNPPVANHLAFLLGDRSINHGRITYTATVDIGTAGRTLCSTVTRRADAGECADSCSSCTFVGTLANVYVEKTGPGPGCVSPGDQLTFAITYGNNGNTSAVNVVVTDVLPVGLTFVSAFPLPTGVTGQSVTWTNLGATQGVLGAGAFGVINVVARFDYNYPLVGQKLTNAATIITSSAEVKVADNRAKAIICTTPGLASLSGYVYHDRNNNCLRDPGDSGIAGVTVTLTGTDAFGKPVTIPTLTLSDGKYSFIGLNPGTYTVMETQPANWASTGDRLGTVTNNPRGMNSLQLDDLLGPITLYDREVGLEYNFCEIESGLCTHITEERIRCATNGVSDLTYTFTVQNLTDGPVKYLSFISLTDCTSPELVSLPTALARGGIASVSVGLDLTANCGTNLCLRVGLHNANLEECCSIERCLPNPFVPKMACPPNLVVECQGPAGTAVLYPIIGASVCASNLPTVCDPPSGSPFFPGSTTVTCRPVNGPAGGPSCSFTVTVLDRTPPNITCPSNIVVNCAGPNGSAVPFTVTASDNCDSNVTVACTRLSNSIFALGTTPVVCTATDDSGNTNTCPFTVTVRRDTTRPIIAGCQPVTVDAQTGQTNAAVNYTVTATDDSGSVVLVCTPPTGSSFRCGATTVSCVATDPCGNTNLCSFVVTVRCGKGDLFVEDTPYNHTGAPDLGREPDPNMTGLNMWMSRGIWVHETCNPPTPGTYLSHQNPRYGQENCVFVNVTNRGSAPLAGAKLEVWYANASMGLSWIGSWKPIGTNDLPSINAGTNFIARLSWSPPGVGHYCLLARIVSVDDPMKVPEGPSVGANVRTNNNIAWRNVNVAECLHTPARKVEVRARNPGSNQQGAPAPAFGASLLATNPVTDPITFMLTASEQFLATGGDAVLELGQPLFARWQAAGANGSNVTVINGNQLRCTGSPAYIRNIPFARGEERTLYLTLSAIEPMPVPGTNHVYDIGLVQLIADEPVGGVNYAVSARAQDTDTDHDGVPDIMDPDDDGDGVPDANDPDPLGEPDCPPAALTIARTDDGFVELTWAGLGYRLQSVAVLGEAWTTVAGATSPARLPANAAQRFFRLVCSVGGACSINVVGYVNATLHSGSSLIANPLNGTTNHLNTILPLTDAYTGTTIARWNVATQTTNQPIKFVAGSGWSSSNTNEDYTLNPGEGFWIALSNSLTVTFVGEVPQGNLVNPLPAQLSIKSSIVPEAGSLTSLGFPAEDGDQVFIFDSTTQRFRETYQYIDGVGWLSGSDPGVEGPLIPVATAFYIQKGAAGAWIRVFNIGCP